MLDDRSPGHDIPAGFLTSYERNFKFLTFPTREAKVTRNYKEEVAFRALKLKSKSTRGDFGKIGGAPDWVLDNESPGTYNTTTPMAFLLELMPGIHFETVDEAPPQTELDIFGNPSLSPLNSYQLFLGNAVYLFGTSVGEPLVYAITQA